MTKQSILSICKLIELLKMVKKTLDDYSADIFNTTLCLTQYQLYQALFTISNAKVSISKVTNKIILINIS